MFSVISGVLFAARNNCGSGAKNTPRTHVVADQNAEHMELAIGKNNDYGSINHDKDILYIDEADVLPPSLQEAALHVDTKNNTIFDSGDECVATIRHPPNSTSVDNLQLQQKPSLFYYVTGYESGDKCNILKAIANLSLEVVTEGLAICFIKSSCDGDSSENATLVTGGVMAGASLIWSSLIIKRLVSKPCCL